MPSNTAAFWSPIAALFAALSSFLIMLIARRNLLESTRPELVLTGWTRRAEGQGDAAYEVIAFQTLRNVGRGAAFNIIIYSSDIIANLPTAIVSSTRLPILAANETNNLNGEIIVYWKNVESDSPVHKNLFITVEILCWDSRGMRYETRYKLFAVEFPEHAGMPDPIAQGVALTSRTTVARPTWLLKLFSGFKRIAGPRRWSMPVVRKKEKRGAITMTMDELKAQKQRLEAKKETFKKILIACGRDAEMSFDKFCENYASNPQWERIIAYYLGIPIEEEKRTMATVNAAKSARRSASIALIAVLIALVLLVFQILSAMF